MANYQQVAARIERLHPEAMPQDVARILLLLANDVEDLSELDDDRCLAEAWQRTGMRLQAVTDQHAAMTEELEALARDGAGQFTPEQIQVLVRAIKVQSQVLQMYVGKAPDAE